MAPRPLTRAQAHEALAGKTWLDALRRLPADVDPALVVDRVLSFLDGRGSGVWHVARRCQSLPVPVITLLLERLAEGPQTSAKVFLREFMGGSTALAEDWAQALKVLLDLEAYAWGSKQKRLKLEGVAKNPRALAAVQAAVVGSSPAPLVMLAVLALDGSEVSSDALMPVFAGAQEDERLARLKTYAAKTPAMQTLLGSVAHRREEKERQSPALDFAREVLGLELARLDVDLSVSSRELNGSNVPRYQGSLRVDSGHEHWWSMGLSRVTTSGEITSTRFGPGGARQDALELGAVALEQLPDWLARAQKTFSVRFNTEVEPRGSLRGKKRALFADWLFQRIR
jgi:hypothetical protein